MLPKRLISLLLAGIMALSAVQAAVVKFDLPTVREGSNSWVCIGDFASQNSLVSISYKLSEPAVNMRTILRILDPSGNRLHLREDAPPSGDFTFATLDPHGAFEACFMNVGDSRANRRASPQPRSVVLDIRTGHETNDYDMGMDDPESNRELLTLRTAEQTIRQVLDISENIRDEMTYIRSREARLRRTNESTYDRVKWFGYFSVLVMILLGVYQVSQVRSFLRKKKAI
ncbi:hypothetical protein H696_00202 [Fonticula alba]|uniref:GOLD domain-containing protein n=1 Tax=Fonticula alba TaxID=691883 RepID=A0A058ZFA8_FONAL|nr:hypothetical protein H696_00202 [Fonticula alba]KCV72618.1 hypothetical protein H696_00202 [Fonticula alba]|eukprot:XP_009492319.1 hypothetical protein H696_00202 [Fonticula alba]